MSSVNHKKVPPNRSWKYSISSAILFADFVLQAPFQCFHWLQKVHRYLQPREPSRIMYLVFLPAIMVK